VCNALTRLVDDHPTLHVNYRTGLHITLGTRLNTKQLLKGFVRRVQRLEPGLMTLVSPSRLYHYDNGSYYLDGFNQYCLPVREMGSSLRSDDYLDCRYHTVNLTQAWGEVQKLEVRMHNGTTEFEKIGPWISLWMLIFNNSRYAWKGRGVADDVFPDDDTAISPDEAKAEDIFALLEREGVFMHGDMRQRLWERRRQLSHAWSRVIPRRVESWNQAGWYDQSRMVRSSALQRSA
jgi:Putative amidoligase enzyme